MTGPTPADQYDIRFVREVRRFADAIPLASALMSPSQLGGRSRAPQQEKGVEFLPSSAFREEFGLRPLVHVSMMKFRS
jgi:hypothetical protein